MEVALAGRWGRGLGEGMVFMRCGAVGGFFQRSRSSVGLTMTCHVGLGQHTTAKADTDAQANRENTFRGR